MAVFLDGITLDCADGRRLATFWAATLGYVLQEEAEGEVVVRPVEGGGPILGFQPVPEPKTSKTRVHLDVRVRGVVTLEEEKTRLVGLGAHVIQYIPDRPGNTHWLMQDPDGNEFCLVEPWERGDRS